MKKTWKIKKIDIYYELSMEKQNRDEKTVFRAAHSVSVLRSEKKIKRCQWNTHKCALAWNRQFFLPLPIKIYDVNEQTSLNQLTLLSSSGYTWLHFGTNESTAQHFQQQKIRMEFPQNERENEEEKQTWNWNWDDQFFCSSLLSFSTSLLRAGIVLSQFVINYIAHLAVPIITIIARAVEGENRTHQMFVFSFLSPAMPCYAPCTTRIRTHKCQCQQHWNENYNWIFALSLSFVALALPFFHFIAKLLMPNIIFSSQKMFIRNCSEFVCAFDLSVAFTH